MPHTTGPALPHAKIRKENQMDRSALEASEGIEPPYKDLQSSASPLRHEATICNRGSV
jgi:hypothetical protein